MFQPRWLGWQVAPCCLGILLCAFSQNVKASEAVCLEDCSSQGPEQAQSADSSVWLVHKPRVFASCALLQTSCLLQPAHELCIRIACVQQVIVSALIQWTRTLNCLACVYLYVHTQTLVSILSHTSQHKRRIIANSMSVFDRQIALFMSERVMHVFVRIRGVTRICEFSLWGCMIRGICPCVDTYIRTQMITKVGM